MIQRKSLAVVAAVTALLVTSCGPATTPCGTFDFTGSPHTSRGINVSLDFDFNPASCSAPACTCNTVAWVQIVRIIDLQTGNYLSPNSDQTNRLVTGRSDAWLNGWAVDRISGLTAAYELVKAGIACTIIDPKPLLGGVIRTENAGGCLS